MATDELLQTLSARLASLGVAANGPTVRATLRPDLAPTDADALRTLHAIASGHEHPLAVLSTIGEGGMGIVQLGVQRSLAREVAIKTLRQPNAPSDAVARLVREAVVTGSLEHPNIVPVYDLAMSEQGAPLLVMKRIEGSTWTEKLRVARDDALSPGAEDNLEWHLRTLMSVCQGTHFAHSLGVVHRDLKPDNVMVGSFGEVYLVDWGVAFQEGDVVGGAQGKVILGTPAYMAPEILLCEAITPRTDVYLLGAILFEILAGRAPHDIPGGLGDLVLSVLGAPPPLPSSAPEELAHLVAACMQPDPAARPESAEDVRLALADFLRHRGSGLLAQRAEARLSELDAALVAEPLDADRVQRLYGEVSFGFRASLEQWPENEAARRGLTQATRALVRHELAHGMARAARARLADLVEPDESLRAEVERANIVADEAARRAARLEADSDPRTEHRVRNRVVIVIGSLWTLQPIAQHFGWLGPGAESRLAGALTAIAFAVVWAFVLLLWRERIMRSRLNRQLMAATIFVLFAQIVAYAGAAMLGLSAANTQTMLLFVWFSAAGILGATADAHLLVPAVAFLLAFGIAAFNPHWRLLAESGGNLVLVVVLLWAWRSNPSEPL